ncbi:MAG: phospho-N-acetylmuramoyl-pentapeptide-transferase [Candidatus Berkelbacteria bacterium Athens1014_28]|uniref:Phospho-N-acetylmuramoyl-pentapeptide-transferase n=1 Tax=Candidatus Berkelbacteria bacterium Athens1014_28 TaxID=2017145 RepID=A0A554LM69_9BACT|nr:MAG: phospho-N-acetylmuramoyl-pentapeptide-transferase [Candidatus Berkelbacteria bacterium Athens1014_28]
MEQIVLSKNEFIRLFWLSGLSFLVAMIWTPLFTNFLYKYKLGKRIREDKNTPIFSRMHAHKAGTPTIGGVLIWITVLVITLIFNLERRATWLPLFTLVSAGLIGLVDDLMNVYGVGAHGGGLRFRQKFPLYALVAAVGGWWFYSKLGWHTLHVPGFGDFSIGAWYIPLFILALVWAAFASNATDGLDGLAGGIFALAGDTGSMALGFTLGIIAFLTNSIVVFPIITLVFTIEGLSFLIQRFWRITFKRKLFLSSPFHHHLEAIGWPEQKIVMRFWVIGAASSVIGLAIALFGRGL